MRVPVHPSPLCPREVTKLANSSAQVARRHRVDRLRPASSTRITVPAPAIVHARLGARITITAADLPPALMATIKHAASMANPVFYERQRRRASTWNIPRFLRSYDETLAGDLVLPRGLHDRVSQLIAPGRQPA